MRLSKNNYYFRNYQHEKNLSSTYWRAVVLFRVVSFSEFSFNFMGRDSVAYFFYGKRQFSLSRGCVRYGKRPASDVIEHATPPNEVPSGKEQIPAVLWLFSNQLHTYWNKSVNITQSRSTILDLTSWTHSAQFQDVLRRWSHRKRWAFHSEMKGKWYICAKATKVHFFSRTSRSVPKLACVTLCSVKLKVLARFKTRK